MIEERRHSCRVLVPSLKQNCHVIAALNSVKSIQPVWWRLLCKIKRIWENQKDLSCCTIYNNGFWESNSLIYMCVYIYTIFIFFSNSLCAPVLICAFSLILRQLASFFAEKHCKDVNIRLSFIFFFLIHTNLKINVLIYID